MTAKPVLRRCVACRHQYDRSRMLRVVRLATGGIALDAGFGRSAYVCRSATCLQTAWRRKALQKSLRVSRLDDTIYVSLVNRLPNPLSTEGNAEAT